MRELSCEIAVVGAGPAGLAAAVCAGELGRRVVLVDENASVGGQIWRGSAVRGPAARWRRRVAASGGELLTGAAVIDAAAGRLELDRVGEPTRVRFEKLILASGARELFLPFPGWTLPGVVGVGGLQALIRGGWNVREKRVLVSGSGPLLVAVAAFARRKGANVVGIVEQAPAERVSNLVRGVWRYPRKLMQGVGLRCRLLGVPYMCGSWVTLADGDGSARRAEIADGDCGARRVDCDVLATGFGLVPNTHLAALLGCRIERGAVAVDGDLRTTVSNVFAAGEAIGIGGVECATIEGSIAGAVAAGDADAVDRLGPKRARARRFAALLDETFALRPEVLRLAADDALVCRCEDVAWGRIRARSSWRDAKLQTRCGMGACQGRVCGPAVARMTGWEVGDARPPLVPTRVGVLAGGGRADVADRGDSGR